MKVYWHTLKTQHLDNNFNLCTSLDKQKNQRKNVNIFLPISFNLCFGSQKNRLWVPTAYVLVEKYEIEFSFAPLT